MQSAADKYIKAIFVLKLTFSGGGGSGGNRNPKMYYTTDKKDPEPTEYFIQINADYTRTCGILQSNHARTNGFQTKPPREHSLSKGKCMKTYEIMFSSSFSNYLVQRQTSSCGAREKGTKTNLK